MGRRATFQTRVIYVVIGMATATALGQPRHGDNVVIGRSASGQLVAHFDFDDVIALDVLPPGDQFSGWASDAPGFESAGEDEPAEDLFTLPEGARIRMEVVRAADAFAAVDGATFELLDEPGEGKFLGPAPFESHVLWLIDAADPAIDPAQTVWEIDLRFVDEQSLHAASDTYTLSFTGVPEPAGAVILGIGSLLAARRPRRV